MWISSQTWCCKVCGVAEKYRMSAGERTSTATLSGERASKNVEHFLRPAAGQERDPLSVHRSEHAQTSQECPAYKARRCHPFLIHHDARRPVSSVQ